MSIVVFVVGAPGVGKTTLVRELLEPNRALIESPKWTVGPTVCAAGHYVGGKFDGADTVPYNGVQTALQFWEQRLASRRVTILDGDRFSFAGAREFFAERGVRDTCLYLDAASGTIQARREQRGTAQNATWVKGRVSKAANFATGFVEDRLLRLDAARPAKELATEVLEFLAQQAAT